jgi:hypothetical protein
MLSRVAACLSARDAGHRCLYVIEAPRHVGDPVWHPTGRLVQFDARVAFALGLVDDQHAAPIGVRATVPRITPSWLAIRAPDSSVRTRTTAKTIDPASRGPERLARSGGADAAQSSPPRLRGRRAVLERQWREAALGSGSRTPCVRLARALSPAPRQQCDSWHTTANSHQRHFSEQAMAITRPRRSELAARCQVARCSCLLVGWHVAADPAYLRNP